MDWIPVVVTFFLGLVSALGIEFGKSQLERWQRRNDRRADFQRERLVDLLGPARAMFDWIEKYYRPRWEEYWKYGEWPYALDDLNLTEQERLTYVRCITDLQSAASLIGDSSISAHVEELISAARNLFGSEDGQEATIHEKEANNAYLALVARVGDLMKKL